MLLEILAIAFGIISLVTFILYGIDKWKAVRGAWRISEKVLLLMSFFGGAVGGFVGMQLFRHKTKHFHFTFINIIGMIWQLGLLGYLCYIRVFA